MKLSPMGQLVLVSDSKIRILEKQNLELIFEINAGEKNSPFRIQFLKNQNIMFIGTREGSMYIYNISEISNIQLIKKIDPIEIYRPSQVYSFAVSKDERFIAWSEIHSSFKIYDIQNISNPVLAGVVIIDEPCYQMKWTDSNILVYPSTLSGKGIEFFDLNSLYSANPQTDYPITKFPIIWERISQSGNSYLQISDDKSYFVIDYEMGTGLMIFDLEDEKKPKLLQIIKEEYRGNKVIIAKWEYQNSIFHLTQSDIVVYKQKTVEEAQKYTNTFPHIFNTHQTVNYQVPGSYTIPWRIAYNSKGTLLFSAYGAEGVQIYDISNPFEATHTNSFKSIVTEQENALVDGLIIHPRNDNLMIVGKGSDGVYFYNITEIKNISFLSKIKVDGDTDDVNVFNTDDNLVLTASGRYGISIINITDIKNPILKSTFGATKDSLEEVCLSFDDKYAIAAARSWGVYVFDIQNQENIKLISSYYTGGGEGVTISKKYSNVVYLADGMFGVKILNASDPYQIKEISSLKTGGRVMKLDINQNESFIFTSQMYGNQLTLIDITDLSNPYITQVMNEDDLGSFDVKILPNQKFLFHLTNFGFTLYPLQTNHFIIQEAYFNQQQIDIYQPVQIGQNIDLFMFNYLNPDEKMLNQVYQYKNQQLINLPAEMSFIQSQRKVNMEVLHETGRRIFVFELRIRVSSQDFLLVSESTNNELAVKIYDDLKKSQYIDKSKFLKGNIDQFQNIKFSDVSLIPYKDKIQKILNQKIEYVPLRLMVSNSITFNKNMTQQDQDPILFSYSKEASIKLTVPSGHGKFIKKNFQSVISLFSEESNSCLFSGFLDNINLILKSSIRFQPLIDLTKINVKVSIEDQLKQTYDGEYKLQDIKFIKINQPVMLMTSLQDQIEKDYSNGEVFIEQPFEIKLKPDSFQDNDDASLSYQLILLKIGSKKINVPITQITSYGDFTINFSKQDIKIELNGNRRMYKTKVYMKLVVTDGYTEASDEIVLNFNKIPALYILQKVLYSLSPVFAFLGFLRYSGFFYNIFCQSKYKYSPFLLEVAKPFKLVVLLQHKRRKVVLDLYNELIKELKKIDKKEPLQVLLCENQMEINQPQLAKFIQKIQDQNEKFKNCDYKYLETNQENYILKMINSLIYYNLLQKHSQSKEIFKEMKNYALKNSTYLQKDWYRYYYDIEPPLQVQTAQPFPIFKLIEQNYGNAIGYIIQKKENLGESHQNIIQNLTMEQKMIVIKHIDQTCDVELSAVKKNKSISSPSKPKLKSQDINKCISIYQKYKLFWIQQGIIAVMIGLQKQKFLEFSSGVTINSSVERIYKVIAFTKNNKRNKVIQKILSLMNMDWSQVPFSENSPLPEYLNIKYHRDVLEIERIKPFRSTDLEYKIKIISKYRLTLAEFILSQNSSSCSGEVITDVSVMSREFQTKQREGEFSMIEQSEAQKSPNSKLNMYAQSLGVSRAYKTSFHQPGSPNQGYLGSPLYQDKFAYSTQQTRDKEQSYSLQVNPLSSKRSPTKKQETKDKFQTFEMSKNNTIDSPLYYLPEYSIDSIAPSGRNLQNESKNEISLQPVVRNNEDIQIDFNNLSINSIKQEDYIQNLPEPKQRCNLSSNKQVEAQFVYQEDKFKENYGDSNTNIFDN